MSRFQVRFSAAAAEQLETFHRRRRGMLKREIDRVAGRAPKEPFVQARTPLDIAACEVLEDQGLMLVYAVIPRQELLRMLWGSEVDQRVRRREMARLMRGRWPD